MIVAIHIPIGLIKTNKIKIFANTAIDLDYNNFERDFEIKDFVCEKGVYFVDYNSLRLRGIDLHESYAKGLPWNLKGCEKMGIKQDFFLLDICKISRAEEINKLKENTKLLNKNKFFLHGFFGDQNIFGRRVSEYLPKVCYKVLKIK